MGNRILKEENFKFLSYIPDIEEHTILDEHHGILYFFTFSSGEVKAGELISVNGHTAYDAFSKSYQHTGRNVPGPQEYTLLLLVVFDKNKIEHDKTRGYDRKLHEFINKHYTAKKISFYCPTHYGDGNIELIENYNHAEQYPQLKEILDMFFSDNPEQLLQGYKTFQELQDLADIYGKLNAEKNRLEKEVNRLKDLILKSNQEKIRGRQFLINITESSTSRFDQKLCIADVGVERFNKWKRETISKAVRVSKL